MTGTILIPRYAHQTSPCLVHILSAPINGGLTYAAGYTLAEAWDNWWIALERYKDVHGPADALKDAPRDGRPVRLFAKFAPPEGLICRWRYHPGTNSIGWVDESGAGLAVFDWTGWEPVDGKQ